MSALQAHQVVGLFSISLLLVTNIYADEIDITTDEVDVRAARENLIGVADSASQGLVAGDRIANIPLLRPGEALEQTPGLIVSQHSGSGKANQYYLRGFNLDHGTDFSLSLVGTPINNPTHAHGQGYADANFLIPELIESIEFRKGPYFADLGDFSLAGAAKINYYHTLPKNIASATVGEDGYRRLLIAGSSEQGPGELLYAFEANLYDGPWDNPENTRKLNGVLRWNTGNDEKGFDLLAILYHNRFDSTDQVPLRAINSGLIGRFGAIDPTDGGRTHRYSLSADWHNGPWKANAYFIDYSLDLFSNFTFFLDDPINGDQFHQADRRKVYGGAVSRHFDSNLFGQQIDQDIGLQTRYDDIGQVALSKTVAQHFLSNTRNDSVKQFSGALWWQAGWQATERLRATVGLRGDYYHFDVISNNSLNSVVANANIVSPKLGLIWRSSQNTDLYFNYGNGFHSNDGRGSTITVDPKTGDPLQKVNPLVRGRGTEIGIRGAWLPGWQTTLALFNLDIDSELLFTGDAGTTEPSRPSRRNGVEWSNHYLPTNWLYVDANFAISRAQFRDSDPVGNNYPVL